MKIFAKIFLAWLLICTVGLTQVIPAPKESDKGIPCSQTLSKKTEEGKPVSLGKKIQCGTVELSDVSRFLAYIINNFVAYFGATAGVFMILYSGYQYIFGGITEDKEQGKKTLKWAIIGVIVTFLSWNIVDWVQVFVTGL